MTFSQSMDDMLSPAPGLSLELLPLGSQAVFLVTALLSWVLGEALMAPVLRPWMLWLCLGYTGCFFLFTGWYFRMSRLFESDWRSYPQAIPLMIWALTPLHLVFPTALIATHSGWVGSLAYELMKAGVLLAVLARMVSAFQVLNHWPRWANLALTLSPLVVAFMGVMVLVLLGGAAVVALSVSALQS